MDWVDIWLHVVATIVLMAIGLAMTCGTSIQPMHMALAITAFWFAREMWQDVRKKNNPPWPIRPSAQKWAEFVAPAIVAFVMAALANSGDITMGCAAN